ncbi:hypothetical protein [Corynebacterium liangguodongii]|uniref:Uncharacterized protein n=1 Tax=Corynebacterium liangguodongii TaxID=2079535 RepID=A0A2S0WG64_9CORY|nr:hypothetical protein [Corynebacterium liangguodongii]AWB84765.1 hypothetical protein C3E79_10015 [Corynebacterium liangguodongii]PWB99123.1 hypothetical protein DF219_07630 [Corynebacterium liangguodongii]
MTTMHDLALRTAGALGITDDAAHAALETYRDQIEALEGRTIDPDDISDDDAGFLTDAVRAAQRSGDLGARETAALEEAAADFARASDDLETARQVRDAAILTAARAGVRPKDIIEITGLSRARLDQIRRA